MKLSSETEKKLDAWVKVDTWHTNHKLDMDRWYDFVNQYQKDHGYSVDESALREIIEKKVEGNVNDLLREEIRTRISLACNILGFLNRTGR
ncbi:MAG: hypothetical protein KKI12_06495 [Proteobacteria bacterium]|nr:hypothetical protein [Pseudomonadota bacterium]